MSALLRISDLTRTSRDVRKVPEADIARPSQYSLGLRAYDYRTEAPAMRRVKRRIPEDRSLALNTRAMTHSGVPR
jgi:hypothetical protein